MYENNLVEQAIIFAVNAHGGAYRKGGKKMPYIIHPLETLSIAATMTNDWEVLAAAVLHDTIEDAGVSVDQLIGHFGGRVAALVCADSENKQDDKPRLDTWKQRKQETIDNLRIEKDIPTKIIVLSDKLANIRNIFADYEKVGESVWDKFNNKNKNDHAWYYNEIAEAVSTLSDFTAYKEYKSILEKLFV
jgi:myo-inositol-1(or 4)-monophosphatase